MRYIEDEVEAPVWLALCSSLYASSNDCPSILKAKYLLISFRTSMNLLSSSIELHLVILGNMMRSTLFLSILFAIMQIRAWVKDHSYNIPTYTKEETMSSNSECTNGTDSYYAINDESRNSFIRKSSYFFHNFITYLLYFSIFAWSVAFSFRRGGVGLELPPRAWLNS